MRTNEVSRSYGDQNLSSWPYCPNFSCPSQVKLNGTLKLFYLIQIKAFYTHSFSTPLMKMTILSIVPQGTARSRVEVSRSLANKRLQNNPRVNTFITENDKL